MKRTKYHRGVLLKFDWGPYGVITGYYGKNKPKGYLPLYSIRIIDPKRYGHNRTYTASELDEMSSIVSRDTIAQDLDTSTTLDIVAAKFLVKDSKKE